MVGHGQFRGRAAADATLGCFDQGPFGYMGAHIAGQSQAVQLETHFVTKKKPNWPRSSNPTLKH